MPSIDYPGRKLQYGKGEITHKSGDTFPSEEITIFPNWVVAEFEDDTSSWIPRHDIREIILEETY